MKIAILEDDPDYGNMLTSLLVESFSGVTIVEFGALDCLLRPDEWKDSDLFITDGSLPLVSCLNEHIMETAGKVRSKFPEVGSGYDDKILGGALITRQLRKDGYTFPIIIFSNNMMWDFPSDIWDLPHVNYCGKSQIKSFPRLIQQVLRTEAPK